MLEPLEIELPKEALQVLINGGKIELEGLIKNMNIIIYVKKD